MLSIAPYLPEMGKRAVIEDFIEARGGPESLIVTTHLKMTMQQENSNST